MIFIWTQVDLGCCAWEGTSEKKENQRARLSVKEVVPWSTVGGGRIDVSLMASELLKKPDQKGPANIALMGMFEVKKLIQSDDQCQKYVSEAVCYMISALAFSRWGMLGKLDPLVALLISPTKLYRLTLSKPQDEAIGLNLKIKNTTDLLMMEWVLSEYVKSYVNEQRQLNPANIISPDSVNPFDWAPLNFDGSKWTPISKQYNLGFLFRTTSDEVTRVCSRYQLEPLSKQPLRIPPGMPVLIKHTSILLENDYRVGIASIQRILQEERLRPTLEGKPLSSLDIIHPYIAIIGKVRNPLIIMKDMGEPLSELMQQHSFRIRWAQSTALRSAFLSQVGISALNLVKKMELCHNDIRPPNIAVSGNSFCLVDFDMCRNEAPTEIVSAFVPTVLGIRDSMSTMMCFSVAQIVLSVFMLSSQTVFSVADVTEAVSVWRAKRDSSSNIDKEFEDWIQSRGGILVEFVDAVRGSASWPPEVRANCKGFCRAVLEFLLA